LLQRKINKKVLLAFLKTLGINSNNGFESQIKFRFSLSFGLIGRLSQQFSGSQAAFRTTFRVQKAGTNSLKRILGRIFPITG
jgi:hypothetical protein